MGSEISLLIVEPILGIGIVALCIMAIIEQNKNNPDYAKWFAIGAVILSIVLIIASFISNFAG